MRKFYTGVVKHKILIICIFIIAAIAAAIMKPLVAVNYDIKDYLPEETKSTKALNVMKEEFTSGVPNARIMLKNVTINEALQYKKQIEAIDGVTSVMWMDDTMIDAGMPLSLIDDDTLNNYFRVTDKKKGTGNALMSITILEEKNLEVVSKLQKIASDDNCLAGGAVSTAVATEKTVTEIAKVVAISILMVLIILIFTTESWIEPMIILAGLGIAILVNMGTNLIFGEISFVTNASGSILQLAVSLDYSVFLIHRFESCRREDPNATEDESMIKALCMSTPSILSSGLTTVIGFLALILMRFQIGPDMGLALAKGVIISLITAFTFLPAITLIFCKLIDKTKHRKLLPSFARFAAFVRKVMIPAMIVFAVAIIPSFIMSNMNHFYYGSSHIFGTDTKVGRDTEEISKVFGSKDTYALMVPRGNYVKEHALIKELKNIPQVSDVKSHGETISDIIPPEIVPEFLEGQLTSDKYSRIVLTVDAEYDGEDTFALVRKIRKTASDFYNDEWYLAGEGVSTTDMEDTVTDDMLKVNIIAILAVLLILIIMFRSLLLPLILVACIETAIWINVAFPFVMDTPVFYIAYLIISSVQLGATVDYAILMTDRYREMRVAFSKEVALRETIKSVFPSVMTSGSALIIVGFLMGFMTSHNILAQLGIFIGRGALCSLAVVFLALPALLFVFDRFCIKKTKNTKA